MVRRNKSQYNWAKLQFDERILTKHFTKGRAGKPLRFVVIHHSTIMATNNGAANDKMWSVWQNRQASAHYGVDKDFVMQFVYDSNTAWATGSNEGNQQGISIEHHNKTGAPSWEIDSVTWKTGAKLAGTICFAKKLGRPKSNSAGTTGNLRFHSSFKATACPGPYMKKIWTDYVKEAQKAYDALAKPAPAPKPTPKPTPTPPKSEDIFYVVKKGDTLSRIAATFNTTLAQLMKWNPGIKNKNLISVGQKIKVGEKNNPTPTPPTPTPKPEPKTEWREVNKSTKVAYTIKKGDSLSKIAKSRGTTVAQLMKWNPSIKNKNKIFVGQKIQVGVRVSKEKVEVVRVRAATLNIPLDAAKLPHGKARAKIAANEIKLASLHFLACQELDRGTTAKGHEYAEMLLAELPKSWRVIKPTTSYNENYIFFDSAKAKLVKQEKDLILRSKKGGRHATRAFFEVEGVKVEVFNTHLHNGALAGSAREEQAKDLAPYLTKRTILMGDFNQKDLPKAIKEKKFTSANKKLNNLWTDLATYAGFSKKVIGKGAIDLVAIHDTNWVMGYSVRGVKDDRKTLVAPRASDHLLVVTSIQIRK